ncbi:hypothetical protein MRB53_040994 [Persea americana]|nr:hypothetical protein MRB53_040994 [Persea americana]
MTSGALTGLRVLRISGLLWSLRSRQIERVGMLSRRSGYTVIARTRSLRGHNRIDLDVAVEEVDEGIEDSGRGGYHWIESRTSGKDRGFENQRKEDEEEGSSWYRDLAMRSSFIDCPVLTFTAESASAIQGTLYTCAGAAHSRDFPIDQGFKARVGHQGKTGRPVGG